MAGEMPTSLAPATMADSLHPMRGYSTHDQQISLKQQRRARNGSGFVGGAGSNRNHVEQRRAEDLLLLLLVARAALAPRPRRGPRRRPVGPSGSGTGGGGGRGRGARALRPGRLGGGLQRRRRERRRRRRRKATQEESEKAEEKFTVLDVVRHGLLAAIPSLEVEKKGEAKEEREVWTRYWSSTVEVSETYELR